MCLGARNFGDQSLEEAVNFLELQLFSLQETRPIDRSSFALGPENLRGPASRHKMAALMRDLSEDG